MSTKVIHKLIIDNKEIAYDKAYFNSEPECEDTFNGQIKYEEYSIEVYRPLPAEDITSGWIHSIEAHLDDGTTRRHTGVATSWEIDNFSKDTLSVGIRVLETGKILETRYEDMNVTTVRHP